MNADDYAYTQQRQATATEKELRAAMTQGLGQRAVREAQIPEDLYGKVVNACAAQAAPAASVPKQQSYSAIEDQAKGALERAYWLGRSDEETRAAALGSTLYGRAMERLHAIDRRVAELRSVFRLPLVAGFKDSALDAIDQLQRLASSTFEIKPKDHANLFWDEFVRCIRSYGPLADKQELGKSLTQDLSARAYFTKRVKELLQKEKAYDALIDANNRMSPPVGK